MRVEFVGVLITPGFALVYLLGIGLRLYLSDRDLRVCVEEEFPKDPADIPRERQDPGRGHRSIDRVSVWDSPSEHPSATD